MKIVLEDKKDKAVIVTAMDCVAKHMGVDGLGVQNIINNACTGFGCSPEPKSEPDLDQPLKKEPDGESNG